MRHALRLAPTALAAAVAALALVAACGAGSTRDPNATTTSAGEPTGADLARQYGCAACHGPNGEGGTGPAWIGLFGSEVELKDGSVVVADEAYLRRSIVDPNAEIPANVVLPMPVNGQLTPEAIDALVEYIKSLAD